MNYIIIIKYSDKFMIIIIMMRSIILLFIILMYATATISCIIIYYTLKVATNHDDADNGPGMIVGNGCNEIGKRTR